MSRFSLVLPGALALALLVAAASAQQRYSGEGAAACLQCHESQTVMGIVDTPHANFDDPRSPAAREQCESCHGPSATHMNFPMQVGNIVFTKHGKTPIADRNEVCLACHNEGEQAHWYEGAHGSNLSCASCHTMHAPKDPGLAAHGQGERCGSCHTQILESAPQQSSHPISGEAALSCTQCHNPHGPTNLASCNSCHPQNAAARAAESPKARDYHERAVARAIACTSCHKGFVHAAPLIGTLTEAPPDF